MDDIPDFAALAAELDPAASEAAAKACTEKIAALQARVGPRYPLSKPGRREVLCEGVLWIQVGDAHPSANVRECVLFNDALILLKQEGRSQLSVAEYPLASSTLRDRLHMHRCSKGACAPTVANSFELVASTGSVVLVAPDATTKAQWWAAMSAGVTAAVPFDQRLETGWMHARVQGTLWAAAVAGDEGMARELCKYTVSGRLRAVASDPEFANVPEEPVLHLDAADEDGRTPLHYASLVGHAGVVRALLESGARLDVTDTDEFATPLHVALVKGHFEVATILIHNNAPLSARDMHDRTTLVVALSSGHPSDEVDKIIEIIIGGAVGHADALLELLSTPDQTGWSPIHHAAYQDYRQAVTTIVQRGADPNALARVGTETDADMVTALHIICGALPAALALRRPQVPTVQVDMVATLLRVGVQPNGRSQRTGSTPLHFVLRRVQRLRRDAAAGSSQAAAMSSPVAADGAAAPAAPVGDYGIEEAGLMSVAAKLLSHGARLDIADASKATAATLAEELGVRSACETSAATYASRTAPAEAALGALALERSTSRWGLRRGKSLVTKKSSPRLGVVSAVWAADHTSEGCTICAAGFTLFSRRHHCRQCGALVCGACSSKKFALSVPGADSDDDSPAGGASRKPPTSPTGAGGGVKEERVCDGCFNKLATLGELALREERSAAEAKEAMLRDLQAARTVSTTPAGNAAIAVAAAPSDDAARAKLFSGTGPTRRPAPAAAGAATPGAAAASGSASELKSTLQQVGAKLEERGEKLGRLDLKTQQMADNAKSFADMAAQLKEKSRRGGWF